jgi:hypothetical protein
VYGNGNEDAISLFCGIFEIAQICTDLLEIRIDKNINQMSMDVNQKYCQSCHQISRNGLSLRK